MEVADGGGRWRWQMESGPDLESGSGERRHCRFLAKILDKINHIPLLFVYFIPVGVAFFGLFFVFFITDSSFLAQNKTRTNKTFFIVKTIGQQFFNSQQHFFVDLFFSYGILYTQQGGRLRCYVIARQAVRAYEHQRHVFCEHSKFALSLILTFFPSDGKKNNRKE